MNKKIKWHLYQLRKLMTTVTTTALILPLKTCSTSSPPCSRPTTPKAISSSISKRRFTSTSSSRSPTAKPVWSSQEWRASSWTIRTSGGRERARVLRSSPITSNRCCISWNSSRTGAITTIVEEGWLFHRSETEEDQRHPPRTSTIQRLTFRNNSSSRNTNL